MGKKKPNPKLQIWIDARKRHRLSHAQVQMARELGMNPKRLGKKDNHRQEPWKMPLPQFIEHLYFERFGKERPDVVTSIEEKVRREETRKAERREARSLAREQAATRDESARRHESTRREEVTIMEEYSPASDPDPEAWLALDEADRIALVQANHDDPHLDARRAHLHAVVHSIVETQLAADDPPEVRATLRRLITEGLDRHDAIHAIGSLIAEQLHAMMGGGGETTEPTEAYRRKLAEITASRWRAM